MKRNIAAVMTIGFVFIFSCVCLFGQYPIQRWYLEGKIADIQQLENKLIEDPSDVDALTELKEYAESSQMGGSYSALRTFGRIDAENFNEVRYLATFLQHEDHGTRRAAALAIKEQGQAAVDAIPELITALSDVEGADVRVFAAQTLRNLGPKAVKALPALESALQDPSNESFRSTFETAIEKIKHAERRCE